MTKRIALLIDTGGPGGAETVFALLTRTLAENGWDPVPVIPESGWLMDRLTKDGHDPKLLSSQRSFDGAYLFRLVRLLQRSRADLVHAHLLGSAVYGSLAATLQRLPAICTFHGSVDIASESRLGRFRYRVLDALADRVVFVSQSLREELLERTGIDREKTAVIKNGIELTRFSRSGDGGFRRQLGIGPDEVLVGAVGNVRPAKDYRVLLRAAAILETRDEGYRFVIVGDHDNQLYEELKRERLRLGLDDTVLFAGLRNDIPAVMADLDVFVLTSSSEGFSLATVEALAAGRPVVATRCGGPEEIITDGVEGRLVPPGSPESVADAIRELTESPARARRMAESGRRRVGGEFSVDRMTRQYIRLYEECLR